MRDWILDVLICPVCHGGLVREGPQHNNAGYSWLRCFVCEAEYPIFLDRPILVPWGVEEWYSSIDQAVGWQGPTRSDTESMAWLGEQCRNGMSLKTLVRWRSRPWTIYSREEWIRTLERLRQKAERTRSGEAFTGEIRKKMLEEPLAPIPEAGRPILDEFAARVINAKPRRWLDLASGGGFAFARILAHIEGIDRAVAVEKTVSPLWQIQHRADHVATIKSKRGLQVETVGGDARRLPFRDESFDLTTTYHSLGEICGIGDVLCEAHRVLEKHGKFQLSFHDTDKDGYVPPSRVSEIIKYLTERLSRESLEYVAEHLPQLDERAFGEFLEEADLFVNLDHLKDQLHSIGFNILECRLHPVHRRYVKNDFILLAQKD